MKVDYKAQELSALVSASEIESILDTISEGLQVVVNLDENELTFSKVEVSSVSANSIYNKYKKKSVGLKVNSGSEEVGYFAFILDRSVGIRLAGLMMMMPEPTIKEKVDNDDFSSDDEEVLFEIGNILAGSIDDLVHQNHSHFTSRLKMDSLLKGDDLDNLESDQGVLIHSTITFQTKFNHNFAIFINKNLLASVWKSSLKEEPTSTDSSSQNLLGDDVPKALIIQDESEQTKKMSFYIESRFNIVEVTDIGLAKDILGRERIDLVFVDMESKSPAGIPIDKWIKAVTRTSRLPVIAISSRPTKSMVVSALRSGACDFITVPWDPEKILLKIDEDLAAHQAKMKKTL